MVIELWNMWYELLNLKLGTVLICSVGIVRGTQY